MTPEELNRTIEFIIATEARLEARQEQDKQWTAEMFAKMEQTDARLARVSEELTRLSEHQSRLLEHQSERMDRIDRFYEHWLRQSDETLDLQREALRLLNQILNRLPPFPPNPN